MKDWFKNHGVDVRDAAVRAAKTAVAAFLAVTPVSAIVEWDEAALSAGAVAAGSAAITFVWNVLLDWTRASKENDYSA